MELRYDLLHALISALGLTWTGNVLLLLLNPKYRDRSRQILAQPAAPLICAGLLALSLWLVTGQIAQIEALAGGMRILDARLHYSPAQAIAFAEALGAAGRAEYALFQLSFDTLAPPAFASFVASIAWLVLRGRWLGFCLGVILFYLACVLSANALMPVFMLSYPGQGWTQKLVQLVPWLDTFKYLSHALAWLVILAGGISRVVSPLQD
ncbi:MAG: hypothetical protein ACAI44_33700 [Candidatus Sericytochromatia bacterium]